MALSLDQLHAFVETVEQGSFRKAALRLGKHASTVSELVATLEIDLGFSLFDRSRRSIELTQAGQDMYQAALPVLREAELFLDRADAVLSQRPRRLVVGVESGLRCTEVTRCYRTVVETYPGIDLQVLSGDTMQVLSWIRSGQVDVGLVPTSMSYTADLIASRSFAFSLSRVVGAQIQIDGGSLDQARLRGMIQIAHNFMLDAGLGKAHVASNHVLRANDSHEILEMVAGGLGWGYVPAFLAQPQIAAGRIQAFVVDDAREDIWFSEVVYLTNTPLNPAMRCFIELVRQIPDKL